MLRRFALAAFLAIATPLTAQTTEGNAAETAPAEVADLAEALRLPDLFAVLREEGLAHGQSLETDMFPGGGGARWVAALAAIYDVDRMTESFTSVLGEEMRRDPDALEQAVAFFESDLGQRIVGLEIGAREAFLDEAVEEAARVAAEDRQQARDPKVPLLDRFIAAADLVEMNVAGGLSGNLAFMNGMVESGAYSGLPTDDILSDVWAQEEEIRSSTTIWLNAYLGTAYGPLTVEELQTYVEFFESSAGQRLNAALFAAFDQVFRPVSYELGRAAGIAMLGRDI